jgi:NAD(P)-dependent dehydrogenase (short-subunit alcohol dehydrogenase family)
VPDLAKSADRLLVVKISCNGRGPKPRVNPASTTRAGNGRYGKPTEIANLMCFLASDEAKFLTGAVYMADVGTSAH